MGTPGRNRKFELDRAVTQGLISDIHAGELTGDDIASRRRLVVYLDNKITREMCSDSWCKWPPATITEAWKLLMTEFIELRELERMSQ